MTVARDGTGAAPVAGQPVGRMLDLTPNAINAIAPTDAARPLLGRVPVTGRRNLLTYTEDFSNAAWTTLTTAAITSGVTAPDGTLNAFTATATAGSQSVRHNNIVLPAGVVHTNSIWLRRRTGTGNISFRNPAAGATVLTLTSEWQRFSLSSAPVVTAGYFLIDMTVSGDAVDIAYPMCELGSTATAYQRVVTALDVTEAGVADTYYTSHDGVDDHFALSSSIPITEEMTVVRAFKRASAGIISQGLGTSGATQTEALWFSDNIMRQGLGGTGTPVTGAATTSTGSFVHTNSRNASNETIRRNGAVFSSPSALSVTGSLTEFGRRATTQFNNGEISFLAVFDRELTGAELELVESIAAGTNGAVLP